ncbi:unnamed protein product [Rotaria sp. Silwood2]|nr:unnamed protein product [Rotaria sp. Silwood2]CAF2657999.1 unnamed protein product [Rotaria sp. Silwood2]CAF2909324.1 unnamed protein product [Rotaria sp. Silwood2]CAF3934053.1 unnamed protein product [Rotaria sp. Silwood2]CAF3960869.1 unnamed protein product [Rotaria sp. Silwood2]
MSAVVRSILSLASVATVHRYSSYAYFSLSTPYCSAKKSISDEVVKAQTAKPIEDTIFGKIARKEIKVDLLHDDDQCVAFHDINKQAPTHFLVVPKEPIPQLSACTSSHEKLLGHLLIVAAQVAKKQGLADDGYRLVINNGRNACQSVYHLHIHVLGGRQLDWPPDLEMSDEQKTEWSNVKSLHNDRFIESKKEKMDINSLHPEQCKRLQMLGLITLNTNGEQQEATDEEIDAILQKTIQNEDPNILADKYMMRHGLYDLLKALTTKIVLNRPADPIDFIINDLEKQVSDKANI